MLAKTISATLIGINGFPIFIEIHISDGLSNFHIVGLPEAAVREAKIRIRSALLESDLPWPIETITLNLAPADIRKDGTAFDLPIALALLAAYNFIDPNSHFLKNTMILGELGLDGAIRPVKGILPIAICAKRQGFKAILVPLENAREASLIEDLTVFTATNLQTLLTTLKHQQTPAPYKPIKQPDSIPPDNIDIADISGHLLPKRALEIAASGNHNILFIGPPGSGKTMLAQRITTILPSMTFNESLELTSIYSIACPQPNLGLITQRPFRDPHHSISDVGLAGGGSPIPKPGEISLAHNGVLFLDELPEFKRNVLEVLRQPMENGYINITRRFQTIRFPSLFMLVASMNACPCGNLGSRIKPCNCHPRRIQDYQNRISGPLLDRIDIQIEINDLTYNELNNSQLSENSQTIRKRVQQTRHIQHERFKNSPQYSNAQMTVQHLKKYCQLTPKGHKLMKMIIDNLGMSARAHNRILKLARTIADMENEKNISTRHLSEAIALRSLDRKLTPSLQTLA